MIKSTRKVLKKKVRKVVDSVGPKIFKNFDKMRQIMFDPAISQGSAEKKKSMKKSSSVKGLSASKKDRQLRTGSMDFKHGSEANLINKQNSSNDSFEMPKTIYSDVDLSYLDELELARAFNIFKND